MIFYIVFCWFVAFLWFYRKIQDLEYKIFIIREKERKDYEK